MRFLILILLALQACSCSHIYSKHETCYDRRLTSSAEYFINSNYSAVDNLVESMPLDNALGQSQPIIVASFVGIDGLKSSRFGKTVSEHMGTRLTNKGYRVIELKLRNNVFIRTGQGEFMLSRELKDIMKSHNAQAALLGTYSEAIGHVYLTAKIVNLANGIAVASTDYNLCKDSNIRSLLAKPIPSELRESDE